MKIRRYNRIPEHIPKSQSVNDSKSIGKNVFHIWSLLHDYSSMINGHRSFSNNLLDENLIPIYLLYTLF